LTGVDQVGQHLPAERSAPVRAAEGVKPLADADDVAQSMRVQHVAAQQNVRLALAERRSNGDRRQVMHTDF
jgi:hypothetical protein